MKAFGHTFVPYGGEEMRCINGMCNMVIWPCETEEQVADCIESVEGKIDLQCKHSPNERLVVTPTGWKIRKI